VVFHAENLAQALRDLVDRHPVKEAAIIRPAIAPRSTAIPRSRCRPCTGWPIITG
jgi:hypothetical protein